MFNYDLYVNWDNVVDVFAIPEDLGRVIDKEAKLVKVGTLESSLKEGVFPVVTDYSSLDIYTGLNDSQIDKVKENFMRECDVNAVNGLLKHYIDSMKFEGNIHLLNYVGENQTTDANICVGSSRSFEHRYVEDLSIASQFFVTTKEKIKNLREPMCGYDVEVSSGYGSASMHCYRVKGSVNEDYEICNSVGKISTSNKVVKDMSILRILQIQDFSRFLQK